MEYIKQFKVILFLLSVVALISCNKGIEDENRAKLIGSWAAFEVEYIGCETDSVAQLPCTEQNCYRYIFTIDTLKQQIYVVENTESGVTESEAGRFSVQENSVTLCQSNDGVETCRKLPIKISSSDFRVDEKNGDCTERYSLAKEVAEN